MTTLNITDNPDRHEWDEVISLVTTPNVNQTWEWGEAMSTIKGVRPIRLIAKQDGKPVGVLQAFEWKIGPISMGIGSGESGEGGGPVVPDGRIDIVVALLESLIAKRTLKTTVYTSAEFGEDLSDISSAKMATKHTPVISLLTNSEQMLNERVEQKTRNQISKSEKNDVHVREGSRDDLTAYRSIQGKLTKKKYLSAKHLNTLRSLEHVWDSLSGSQKIKLWLAEKDGEILGGALIFYTGNGLLYRSGVLTEEGRTLYAGNALQWKIICDAIERGYKCYNMCGGTVDENDPMYGITKFKLSFGGEMKSFKRYSSHGNRILRFLVYRLRALFGKNEWFPLLIYP
ncbi:MAG: peptidoglycan bridge formation glycyltransferase FemA/FemB family protein [Candidatus Peribacteraceae bacterium]|jgi:lipid II:glycine glycyltransferase (peptidoglycan interpeptide bridge formation enzyme)|nr:peptidoglycan bridge formation glycyltransferase FemA/FemB family protein [Candidatus Peribacteraceae bacterium]